MVKRSLGINKTKKELYSGEYDKLEAKHLRKLARFGVELVVERVPAMITNTTYIREKVIQLRNQGIDIKVLMVDYAGKLCLLYTSILSCLRTVISLLLIVMVLISLNVHWIKGKPMKV